MAHDDYESYWVSLVDLIILKAITFMYLLYYPWDLLLKLLNGFFIVFIIFCIYIVTNYYNNIFTKADLMVLMDCLIILVHNNFLNTLTTIKFFLLFFIYHGFIFVIYYSQSMIPGIYIMFWAFITMEIPLMFIKLFINIH